MTPTSVVEKSGTGRGPPLLDEDMIAAVESEYAAAMHHLIDQEEEDEAERGTSEYCYPTEYPGAEDEQATRH